MPPTALAKALEPELLSDAVTTSFTTLIETCRNPNEPSVIRIAAARTLGEFYAQLLHTRIIIERTCHEHC